MIYGNFPHRFGIYWRLLALATIQSQKEIHSSSVFAPLQRNNQDCLRSQITPTLKSTKPNDNLLGLIDIIKTSNERRSPNFFTSRIDLWKEITHRKNEDFDGIADFRGSHDVCAPVAQPNLYLFNSHNKKIKLHFSSRPDENWWANYYIETAEMTAMFQFSRWLNENDYLKKKIPPLKGTHEGRAWKIECSDLVKKYSTRQRHTENQLCEETSFDLIQIQRIVEMIFWKIEICEIRFQDYTQEKGRLRAHILHSQTPEHIRRDTDSIKEKWKPANNRPSWAIKKAVNP